MEKSAAVPPSFQTQKKKAPKMLLITGIGCAGLIAAGCLCYVAAMLLGGTLPSLAGGPRGGSGQASTQPVMALALSLDASRPSAYLFIGDAVEDPWRLPAGDYYLEAAGAQDVVYSLGLLVVEDPWARVDLPGLISSSDEQTLPERRQELVLVANAMAGIKSGMLAFLSATSGGFSLPLFGSHSELSAADLEAIEESYDSVLNREKETIQAAVALDGRAAKMLGQTGCRGVCRLRGGISDSIISFFSGIKAVDQQVIDDIVKGSAAMSDGEKKDAFRFIKGPMSGNAQSFDEMIQMLQRGELNRDALRILNSLMDEPTFVAALTEGNERNRPHLEISHDKGATLVVKGTEMEVEIIKQVLQASFPGIEEGFEYADKVDEWVQFIHDTYEDPASGALDVVSGQAESLISDQIKNGLLEMGYSEENADEMAEYLSGEIVNQLVKHDAETMELEEDQQEPTQTPVATEEIDEQPESEEQPTPTPIATPTPLVEVTPIAREAVLHGSLGITTKSVYGYCTVLNECRLVTNKISLAIHPDGGVATGEGTLAADVVQPADVGGGAVRVTHALAFIGECTQTGFCQGTGTGDVAFGSKGMGSYTFSWEGQYFEGAFEGILTNEMESVEMTLTE